MAVRDIDKGYRRIKRDLEKFVKASVLVGIHEEDGSKDRGGITMAGLATVHEFGSSDGRIPQRSFLRSTVDQKRSSYVLQAKAAVQSIVDGLNPKRALERIAEIVRRDVVKKIDDRIPPPLAESTLAIKNRRNQPDIPLIATGELRETIKGKVKM